MLRELVSDSDCILDLLFVNAAFSGLHVFAASLQHANTRRSTVQNVVIAGMVSACYHISATDATVCELFTSPLQSISLESDVIVGTVVFGLTYNRHVSVWYVTRSSNNEPAIIPVVGAVKGR